MPVFSKPRKRPNIMLIVSDDQGSIDINCYGAKDLYTPHLDNLAKRGIKFDQFYVGAAVCSPSRGVIQTGRFSFRNGIIGNGGSLHKDEETVADLLKSSGYKTAIIGKWHMGKKNGGPNKEGYEYFYGHMGGCIENYKHNNLEWDSGKIRYHDLWRNDKEIKEKEIHFGELIVREANNFVKKNKENPFFIYVAFNNPHYPVQPLKHHLNRYKKFKEPRKSYAAFVSTLDEQIGKIIKNLDDLKLREDTFIIFLSDHGHSVETRNNLFLKDADPNKFGGGNAGPYRGWKSTLWEGGLRVPCLMSWPGRIPENEVRAQMVSATDLLPTIVEFTGSDLPKKKIDGHSISKILASKTAPAPDRVLVWVIRNSWAIREGKWKLVVMKPRKNKKNYRIAPEDRPTGEPFLSDMEKDVTEMKNLAKKHPDIVKRLTALYQKYRAET